MSLKNEETSSLLDSQAYFFVKPGSSGENPLVNKEILGIERELTVNHSTFPWPKIVFWANGKIGAVG